MVVQKLQIKNIGTSDWPAVLINNKYAVMVKEDNHLYPAPTKHESLRSQIAMSPEFSRNIKRQEKIKKEISTQKDSAQVWQETVIFVPNQGKIGAFYKFDHATKNQVIFTFWKENK
jgi:hypothetical protein